VKRREAQRDPSDISGLLSDANKILRQNGLALAQAGTDHFADNLAWLNPSTATAAAEYDFDEFMDSSANTGGVELYFVQTITSAQGTASRGVRRAKGIAIASSGDALTVAHEVLHARGLNGICAKLNKPPVFFSRRPPLPACRIRTWSGRENPLSFCPIKTERPPHARLHM